LVQKPRYVILDEATSANDLEHEALIYRCIQDTVEAFISVGKSDAYLYIYIYISVYMIVIIFLADPTHNEYLLIIYLLFIICVYVYMC